MVILILFKMNFFSHYFPFFSVVNANKNYWTLSPSHRDRYRSSNGSWYWRVTITQQRYSAVIVRAAVLLTYSARAISCWSTSCSSDSLSGTSEPTHLSHTSHTRHTDETKVNVSSSSCCLYVIILYSIQYVKMCKCS